MPAVRSDLPANGQIFRYNGIQFSSVCRIESFKATPVWDAAGRTIIWHEFEVYVRDWIKGLPHDSEIMAISQALGHPGGALLLTGKGVGAYNLNVGTVRDVAWGPKPGPFECKIYGPNTTEFTWSVKFAIPNCNRAVFQFAFAETCWQATYRINRRGLTTRTISGHVRIPMTRKSAGNRDLPDCVDRYRDSIDPPRIVGFRRTPGTYTVNFDKTILFFEIEDEEFDSYTTPPPGVMEWTASHTLSTRSAILCGYDAVLEASYVVGKGLDKRIALAHFWKMAGDRLKGLKGLKSKPSGGNSQGTQILAIPTNFSVTEDIAGSQTAKFSLSYTMAGLEFLDMLKGAGLWSDPPDTRWEKWDSSVGDAYLGPRGLGQLELTASDDWIVDLCRDLEPLLPPGAPGRTTTRELRPKLLDLFPEVTAPSSWLHWRCAVEVETEAGTSELRTLPETYLEFKSHSSDDGVQKDGIPDFEVGGVKAFPAGKLVNDPVPKDKQNVAIQRRAAPLVYVYLVGSALRVRFPIPRPRLGKVDGKDPREVSRPDRGEVFRLEQVGNLGDVVWRAVWRLRFVLEKVPEAGLESLLPANPLLELDSGF